MLSRKFNSIISLKWLCHTLTPEYFQHLNMFFTKTCIFFKAKLLLHSVEVRSHCNFLKPFPVYVVKKNEECHEKKSFLAIAGLLFMFLTLPSDSG